RAVVMAMYPVISAEDILFDTDILGDVGSSLSDLGTGGQGGCADLQDVLQKCKYNKTIAAEALGISRTTFWRRMKECGL
ncbi:helix-turn-helix domain-containing protein, partial [uncultured Bilophila sp.]|uniref:helix-turn-helix domain-containing protein n=1 Tax=uncultured Bilophila sp. TaxID=529385 RepID=UPI00280A73B7